MSEEETPQDPESEPQSPPLPVETSQEKPSLDDLNWVVTRDRGSASDDNEE